MTRAVLALNVGSSNIKFAAFSVAPKGTLSYLLFRGLVEHYFDQTRLSVIDEAGDRVTIESPPTTDDAKSVQEELLTLTITWIVQHTRGYDLQAAGHRVIHAGQGYPPFAKLNDGLIRQIEKLTPLDPPGLAQGLEAIRALEAAKPGLPQVACFDSAFYRVDNLVHSMLPLPGPIANLGLEGYGFHGISYEYIAEVLPNFLGDMAEQKVVVAHLGNEASMCAMKQRKHVANTADFSALESLPMATRCGALDPGVILYLLNNCGMSVAQLTHLLYEESGLLGVSGISGDMRELLKSESPHAAEAVNLFVYRIGRELGSLAAALQGLDALVFTGGIGEHAASVRAAACRAARWLGIDLDEAANLHDGPRISTLQSSVSAWVIPTNEEHVIARHTLEALSNV